MLTRHQRKRREIIQTPAKIKSSLATAKQPKFEYAHTLFCTSLPEPYVCDICRYKTNLFVNLKQHSDSNHNFDSIKFEQPSETAESDNSKLYHCRNCSFQTYSLLILLRHVSVKCAVIPEAETYVDAQIITESASPDSSCFCCELCSYKTESVIFFTMHVTAEHHSSTKNEENQRAVEVFRPGVEEKRFKCKRCQYRTRWKGTLKLHTRTMHSKNAKWYKCKQCSYRTKWKNSLKVHETTQHTESEKIKWFQCEHCPHKAKVLSYLKKHILAKHTPFREIKWFKCEVCPYKTKWKANLKAHLGTKHRYQDGS